MKKVRRILGKRNCRTGLESCFSLLHLCKKQHLKRSVVESKQDESKRRVQDRGKQVKPSRRHSTAQKPQGLSKKYRVVELPASVSFSRLLLLGNKKTSQQQQHNNQPCQHQTYAPRFVLHCPLNLPTATKKPLKTYQHPTSTVSPSPNIEDLQNPNTLPTTLIK